MIFEENKYKKWYFSIVETAKNLERTKGTNKYFENHHIIPKSLGGTNTPENLVLLTPREHFICHLLLVRCTQGNNKRKMMHALSFFTTRNLNSKQYETACRYNSIAKLGKNNSMFGKTPWNKGKRGYLSNEAKQKIAEGQKRWRDSGGMSAEYKEKISKSLRGMKKPKGFGDKVSNAIKGENHWNFTGYYHTPHGKFPNSTAIEDILPNQLVRRWCKAPDKTITKSQFTQVKYLQNLGDSVIGKTFREIGFYFESINETVKRP